MSSVVCNKEAKKNFAFTPVETDAIRVAVTEGSGSVATITAREWSGYESQAVVNEITPNPTKALHRWTNY